jgi:hypothetical protein
MELTSLRQPVFNARVQCVEKCRRGVGQRRNRPRVG